MMTVYGFARDQEQAIAVLDELGDACFTEESISVLSIPPRRRVRQSLQSPRKQWGIGDPLGWFPGIDLLVVAGIGPIIASGHALALLHAGAGRGLPAVLRGLGIGPLRAQLLSRRLGYGDIFIAVPVRHAAEAAEVRYILKDRAMEEVANTVITAEPCIATVR